MSLTISTSKNTSCYNNVVIEKSNCLFLHYMKACQGTRRLKTLYQKDIQTPMLDVMIRSSFAFIIYNLGEIIKLILD